MKNLEFSEVSRSEDELQFRQVHSIGNGEFLLSGGIDSPTWPQFKLKCAVALLDCNDGKFAWRTALSNHKVFDYSCCTSTRCLGAIPHGYKSEHRGIACFDLRSGLQIGEFEDIAGIRGLVQFGPTAYAYATYGEESHLFIKYEDKTTSHRVSDCGSSVVKVAMFDEDSLILTFQVFEQHDGRENIVFEHQRWNSRGELIWGRRSKNDTIVRLDQQNLVTYSNAGEEKRTRIEVLASSTGEVQCEFSIASSLANLIAIDSQTVAYCDSMYRLCFYDISEETLLYSIGFPNDVPGWLTCAVDKEARLIVASKANNFISPMSTLATVRY